MDYHPTHGGLFRGQEEALLPRPQEERGGGQLGRPVGPEARRRTAHGDRHLRSRARGHRPGPQIRPLRERHRRPGHLPRRDDADPIGAGRPAQPLQPPGGRRRRAGPVRPAGRHRQGHRRPQGRAGALRARPQPPRHPRRRRLRPHGQRPGEPAHDRPRVQAAPGHRRLRRRRRPRPGQARAHGPGRRPPGRLDGADLGQPPHRGPRGDHRRDRNAASPKRPSGPTRSNPTAGRPSSGPWPRPTRATSSSSPARATRTTRSSGTGPFTSATSRSSTRRSRGMEGA